MKSLFVKSQNLMYVKQLAPWANFIALYADGAYAFEDAEDYQECVKEHINPVQKP